MYRPLIRTPRIIVRRHILQLMDIERPQEYDLDELARRVQELERQAFRAVQTSQKRFKKRKEVVVARRRNRARKLALLQEMNRMDLQPQTTSQHCRQDSLGGMVTQVQEHASVIPPSNDPYAFSSSQYYVSEVLRTYQDPSSPAREHLTTSLQILKSMENSKMPTRAKIAEKILDLPKRRGYEDKKTIVFDMDQTLIHCNESVEQPHDLKITIKFPKGETAEAGINIRPGAIEMLQALKGKYEVMVFTASHHCYANEILDYLDPEGDLIHHRLYRDHCSLTDSGYYVKDLRILGRPMKDVLLVDNAAYSYAFQLDNGVPILPYFQGSHDFELPALQRWLLALLGESDLRCPNIRLFKLGRYPEFHNNVDGLVATLYEP